MWAQVSQLFTVSKSFLSLKIIDFYFHLVLAKHNAYLENLGKYIIFTLFRIWGLYRTN